MIVSSVLVASCAALTAAVCIVLVFHQDYEDGLLGRVGLAFIALAGTARVMFLAEQGFERQVSPIGLLVWVGLALFMSRHLYRFLRWRRSGEGDWRGADRAATCGKR